MCTLSFQMDWGADTVECGNPLHQVYGDKINIVKVLRAWLSYQNHALYSETFTDIYHP